MDSYFTLQSNIEASGEFVDRKSRFIAQLVHIESEDEANAFIETVRKRHYDARHNVPAWILVDGRERQSDDGEPSRTSGMPTLEVLRGAELKNVCCVVTRYFGGTLLGPGGLVRAYTAATQAAVAAAREAGQIVEMTSVVPVDVHVAYPQYEQVLRLAQDSGAKVSDTDYADAVTLHLVFKAGEPEPFLLALPGWLIGFVPEHDDTAAKGQLAVYYNPERTRQWASLPAGTWRKLSDGVHAGVTPFGPRFRDALELAPTSVTVLVAE